MYKCFLIKLSNPLYVAAFIIIISETEQEIIPLPAMLARFKIDKNQYKELFYKCLIAPRLNDKSKSKP